MLVDLVATVVFPGCTRADAKFALWTFGAIFVLALLVPQFLMR